MSSGWVGERDSALDWLNCRDLYYRDQFVTEWACSTCGRYPISVCLRSRSPGAHDNTCSTRQLNSLTATISVTPGLVKLVSILTSPFKCSLILKRSFAWGIYKKKRICEWDWFESRLSERVLTAWRLCNALIDSGKTVLLIFIFNSWF